MEALNGRDSTTKLSEKVVIVTGAGQGIGKAYARRFAGDGAVVLLVDSNGAKVHAAAKELFDIGLRAFGFQVDVGDERSTVSFAAEVESKWGRVDGLVNNAAIFSTLTLKDFWDINIEEWNRVMAVNVNGPWLMTKACLALLKKSEAASIVNVGSDAVWMGKQGYLHYVASKGAVYGMTHAMARELGPFNIRVNTLSPSFTGTEVPRATFTDDQLTGIIGSQALKRIGDPEDLVGVAAFLISSDSRWITGQTLNVNGGAFHR